VDVGNVRKSLSLQGIFGRYKKLQVAKSGEHGGGCIFVTDFLVTNYSCTMHGGNDMLENPLLRPELEIFFLTDPRNLLMLSVSHRILNSNAPRFIFCLHLELSFVFLPAHAIQKHVISL
jgi:hypothetical protein